MLKAKMQVRKTQEVQVAGPGTFFFPLVGSRLSDGAALSPHARPRRKGSFFSAAANLYSALTVTSLSLSRSRIGACAYRAPEGHSTRGPGEVRLHIHTAAYDVRRMRTSMEPCTQEHAAEPEPRGCQRM